MENSLDSKLKFDSICSVRTRSRNRDIFKKLDTFTVFRKYLDF